MTNKKEAVVILRFTNVLVYFATNYHCLVFIPNFYWSPKSKDYEYIFQLFIVHVLFASEIVR